MLSGNTILAVALSSLLFSVSSAQISGKCSGQSCYIASLSGSTGIPFKPEAKLPEGGDAEGNVCIKEYYQKFGLKAPEGLRRVVERPFGLAEKRQEPCKANSLVYTRGTAEPAPYGTWVGPDLTKAMTAAGWYVEPVQYENTLKANKCLGMAGGYAAMQAYDKLAARCPQTKIIAAGFSQGAMASRIGAAFAKESTKKQIYGLALWGDPFNGAPVKGFPDSKVHTICIDGDEVCKGLLKISGKHLSYKAPDVMPGVEWIKKQVA